MASSRVSVYLVCYVSCLAELRALVRVVHQLSSSITAVLARVVDPLRIVYVVSYSPLARGLAVVDLM